MCGKITNLIFLGLTLAVIPASTTKTFDLNDPELVGYWSFDEGAGTVAADLSENSYDGTLVGGASWTDGIYGSALKFNGSNAYVETGQSFLNGLDGFTLAGWVSASNIDVYSSLFGQNDLIEFGFIGGAQVGTWLLGNNWQLVAADYTFDYPSWHHLALAGDATRIVIYIDGHEAASDEGGLSSGSSGFTFKIGAGVFNSTGDPFLGEIDDVWIFSRALTQQEIQSLMPGSGGYPYALRPVPEDGAVHEDTWVNLSWRPGDFAVSHDVYLGDNFEDVNNGTGETFRGNQAATFYVAGFPGFAYPDGLVPGTTYYWRVDEVNDAEPNSPWKGDVWSFWIPPKTAYYPDPADGAESIDPDVKLGWTLGFDAKLHTVYFGDTYDEVNSATGGLPQGTTAYNPGPLKSGKTYYWRVDEFDIINTYKGEVWSFTTEGAVASLKPSNGAVDVKQTQIITWSPGIYAASHEVYFGTDKEAVRNANTSSPEYKGTRNLGSESYDPVKLDWKSTYYWRIDEVNDTHTDSPWIGPVWNFTTANFLIVDDFEDYNDFEPDRIFDKWIDGWGIPTNGATVGYPEPDFNAGEHFVETRIIHSGSQSMPYFYDNSVGNSEATMTLIYPRDWTEKGVNTLTIWFRGNSSNAAERMYVVLNGSAVVYNDDPGAAQIGEWTRWNIDLQGFADQGVNLANVNTIGIGFGDRSTPQAGGLGLIFFDDIHLYRPTEQEAEP